VLADIALHLAARDGRPVVSYGIWEVRCQAFKDEVKSCGRWGVYYVCRSIPREYLVYEGEMLVDREARDAFIWQYAPKSLPGRRTLLIQE